MAYILYNISHLIPQASGKSNFGIVLPEDMRTLGSGKHKVFNTISDATRRQARKRVSFNGIDYEILRIIEVKDATVTSPVDRKKMEELLDAQQLEFQSKLREKIEQEKAESKEKEANILRKRNEDFKREQEERNSMMHTEIFKRAEGQDKFVNNDGVSAEVAPRVPYTTMEKVEIEREPVSPVQEPVTPIQPPVAPVQQSKPVEVPVAPKQSDVETAKVKEQEAAMLKAAKEAIDVPIPKQVVLDDFPVEPAVEPKKVKKAKKPKKSKAQDVSGQATEASAGA